MVSAHDIIYRRARNRRLAKAFGGEINGFAPPDTTIQYEKSLVGASCPIGQWLSDRFELEDGEVAFVSWTEGADVLFQEVRARREDTVRNLVAARTYEDGRLVWLNSCGHGKKLANSIAGRVMRSWIC